MNAHIKQRILHLALVVLPLASPCVAAPLNEPIKPLPRWHTEDAGRAELGRRLFNDRRLSANGAVACSSCHQLDRGGADDKRLSVGLNGDLTLVNTPTVFNASLNFRQFWNGRAASLEAQVDDVIRNPREMGSEWPALLARLAADEAYREAFESSYEDGVTQANVQNAIATYERTLLTPKARFDLFLEGDSTAISDEEKAGYARFKQSGCISCHQGMNVGGNMFQKFGVMGDYFKDKGSSSEADLGRFAVTGRDEDRHVFKVPGLRNVELTAPYFHDASAQTLEDAVDVMFKYQLGRKADPEDKRLIILFLKTLTGETKGAQ